MLGIAGIVHFDGAPVSPEKLQGMVRRMAICPVDYQRQVCLGSVGLAAISKEYVPEDRFEAQPWRTADGHGLLVADAYLTNRDELMPHFGWDAAEAATRPDSAFIVAAYEKWGEDCQHHLEGRFAFAAWNGQRRRLFCAVDHLGFRPFYYWFKGSTFIFATTLRGLFHHPEISRALNDEIVADFLVSHREVSADTLYRDVQRIPRGNTLCVEASGAQAKRYWYVDPEKVLHLNSDGEYLEAFRAEFTRAVRVSLRTHLGVGSMVSGGLDSAAITVVAGKLLMKQGRRLQAFHKLPHATPYPGQKLRELDESRFVRLMQSHCSNIDFHYIEPMVSTPRAHGAHWLQYFDENYVPAFTLIGPSELELLGSNRVGSILYGLGGNALVSLECWPNGYLPYLAQRGRIVSWCHEAYGQRKVYGRSWRQIFRQTVSGFRHNTDLIDGALGGSDARTSLLSRELRRRTGVDARLRCATVFQSENSDFRARLGSVLTDQLAQQQAAAPSVINSSKNSLSQLPLTCRRLNEFCLSIPFGQNIRNGVDRRLLRQVVAPMLPSEIAYRVTRGYPLPDFPHAFANSKENLLEVIRGTAIPCEIDAYISINKLTQLLEAAAEPSIPQKHSIIRALSLVFFIRWLRRSS